MILFFDYMSLIFNRKSSNFNETGKGEFHKKTATIQIERIEHFGGENSIQIDFNKPLFT